MLSFISLRLYLIGLLVISSLNLFGQLAKDSSDYALLWEITGKDLSQPSYLFGSMHIRERAAFQLPDSIRYCVAACTAFATEVHLDSAMVRMLEVYMGNAELDVDEDYITALNTLKVSDDFMPPRDRPKSTLSLWSRLSQRSNKRQDTTINYPTFLDAYLMEYARQQGKRMYGLENIDEHLYETTETAQGFSIFGSNLFQLQDYYYAGNITEIGYLIAGQGPYFDEMALVARNYIMLNSMEKIWQEEEALFSVVGAAHLPGKTGLIQLLRDEGYRLRPIEITDDSRSQADSILTYSGVERDWPVQPQQTNGHYKFALPFQQHYYRNAGVSQQYLAYDIGLGLSYLVLIDRFLPYQFIDFERSFFLDDGYEIKGKHPIQIGDLKGMRYELYLPDDETPYYLGDVFFHNQQLYYLQVGAYERYMLDKEELYLPFFNSLKINRTHPDKWVSVVDSMGGFSTRLPAHYERGYTPLAESEAGPFGQSGVIYHAGYEATNRSSEAAEAGPSTWILYSDMTASPLNPETDEQKETHVKEWLVEFLDADLTYETTPAEAPFTTQTFSGTFYEELPLEINGELLQRGNRFYAIIAIDYPANVLTKKLIPGFQPLAWATTNTIQLVEVDSSLQVYLPAPKDDPKTLEGILGFFDNMENEPPTTYQTVTTTDPATGNHHWLRVHSLPPLFGTTDTLGLLQHYLDSISISYDSVSLSRRVSVQGFPGVMAQLYKYGSKLTYHAQVYVAGDRVVQKVVHGAQSASQHPHVKAFFYEDQWAVEQLGPFALAYKSDQLLAALGSDDPDQVYAALAILSEQQGLKASDLPAFTTQIQRTHWPDSIDVQEVQLQLLDYYHTLTGKQLRKLDRLYAISAEVPQLRSSILHWLAQRQSEAYWVIYFRALFEHTTRADQLHSAAQDSLYPPTTVIQAYWPRLLQALAEKDAHPILWELAAAGYREGFTITELQALATQQLSNWVAQLPVTADDLKALLSCFQTIPAHADMLANLTNLMNEDAQPLLRIAALGARLRARDKVKRKELRPFLEDSALLYPSLRVLNQFPVANLLPKKLDAIAMARHLLEKKWQEQIAFISDIKLDREIEYMHKNKTYYAYIFTFNYDGDKNRLAVVGLFANDTPYFLDEDWVDYTQYTIGRNRRESKARDMLDELQQGKDNH